VQRGLVGRNVLLSPLAPIAAGVALNDGEQVVGIEGAQCAGCGHDLPPIIRYA